MIPELPIALLACARLGITHSVVFGGFSAEALKARIQDLGAVVVITADGGWRRGKEVRLKPAVDEALLDCPDVKNVIVYRRTGSQTAMKSGRDHWWHELDAELSKDPATEAAAEELSSRRTRFGASAVCALHLRYNRKAQRYSHTTAGYLLQNMMTMRWVFDLRDEDVYWCTADIGWVTGHSYIVYGPLAAGATSSCYEGAPDYPAFDRFWRMIEKYRVSIFYTSPTAIRALIRQGDHWPNAHDLSSLRVLGSVGEPINPAAWEWYYRVIGKERCPIVDTWWQTETGSIMISPMPGATPMKPGPVPCRFPESWSTSSTRKAKCSGNDREGYLSSAILGQAWSATSGAIPSASNSSIGHVCRVHTSRATRRAGTTTATTGFWAESDDVMNVSGHRLSTMEVESALVHHPAVAEAAVVGKPHEITGQAVCCFVTLKKGDWNHEELGKELRQWIGKEIGAFARPEEIRFTDALPKTRSGKIMRRLLREIVTSNAVTGDVTTLEDLSVVARLSSPQDED